MLKNWLKKDYITVSRQAADWQAAIRTASEALLRDGAIQECYVEAMIEAVHRLGPYIAIAPGIAIAHAKPDEGVNRCAIAITTLATPVEFGNKDNDPISLIITLATTDHDAHLDAMGDLMNIIADEKEQQAIIAARSAEEIYKIVCGQGV